MSHQVWPLAALSSRNVGNNHVVAWKTGGGTHMTLVYINNVKRGFEQERVKRIVNAFLAERQVNDTIRLPLGDMVTERCIAVQSDYLNELQQAIYNHLVSLGFSVRPLRPLHIDLRGQSHKVVQESVQIKDWLW